jgi:hypothetical protein
MATNSIFSDAEVIYSYSLEDALEDGILVKTGFLSKSRVPVVFTSNLFHEVKDHYKEIIDKGLKMLSEPDGEDTPWMKLRIIEKDRIWVVANSEAVTFMKPEDY